MKAIRVHEQAGISGLSFEDAPDPTPTIGDVLIKVAAVGITHNELDWPLRTDRNGHPRDSIIPGQEVSGVVAALGMGTAGIAVGDEVFGLTDPYRDAAAAEYVAVEARNLARKPRTVDHVHAASVPRAGLTAWQALFDHGKLAQGQTVVIHGAGGAVGSSTLNITRNNGMKSLLRRDSTASTSLSNGRSWCANAPRVTRRTREASSWKSGAPDTSVRSGTMLIRHPTTSCDPACVRPPTGVPTVTSSAPARAPSNAWNPASSVM